MGRTRVHEVTLRLDDMSELFERGNPDPFSESYRPQSYTSGIEFIANEVYTDPSRKVVRATILLPPEHVAPGLEERTREAMGRYCRAQLENVRHDLRSVVWTGSRALVAALALLFLLTAASRLLPGSGFLLQVLKEGMSVAGWVALWFPVQSLTYDLWTHRIDRSVYTRIMDMDLSIRAEAPAGGPRGVALPEEVPGGSDGERTPQ
ncbi:MAG: hypothetical protein ACRDI0_00655 [Actinomycetota bacterium]